MCGIAGWFSPEPLERGESGKTLGRMLELISHRGPDGEGMLLDGPAALGHRRLAIIDLNTGQQPMTIEDGAFALVYNGEIYNYKALRQQLIAGGARFTTVSDTEVILHTYRVHGSAGFSKLRGMFAFALWDQRRGRALLVRDGVGIKPLFYHVTKTGKLLFASEAKAILAALPEQPALDVNALHLLLNFRYLPGDRTLFSGIRQVPPGNILHWSANEGWRLDSFTVTPEPGVIDPLSILEDSVTAHLIADVEVGAYLSGGMDSAAIVALAKRIQPIRSFTLDVGDDPAEARYAAETAAILDVKNRCYKPSPITPAGLRSLLWHLEAPKINAWQSNEIARRTASEVKVALSGLGGDELFLGYNLHSWLRHADRVRHIAPMSICRLISALGLGMLRGFSPPLWSEPERLLQLGACLDDMPRVYAYLRNIWDHPRLRERIYGPRMLESKLDDAMSVLRASWVDSGDPVRDAANYEWREKMVNDLLWHEDRTSMAWGLEVRVPYLDPQLKTWSDAQDTADLMPKGIRKGRMKAILRDLLPQKILARPKSGFQVHAPRFFREQLAALAGEYLSRERVIAHGLFNPDFVAATLRLGTSPRYRWHFFMLYFMLLTHLWLEIFESGGFLDPALRQARE
jgi:asparagine synthase (glutamine-hydrolysing)